MGGLKEHKEFTENKPIEALPLPGKVYIPLSQHLGKLCLAQVKAGDEVLKGDVIGLADSGVYAPVHASLSGKISAIQDYPHPLLGRCKAVVIESDGKDQARSFKSNSQEEVKTLTSERIRELIFEAGIVGMGGASFPAYIKLNPPKPVDTLIINGAECEPYLTSDYRLMLEKSEEIIKGIELVARCLNVKNVIIAIEDNKPEAIELFSHKVTRSQGHHVVILRSKYPQGGEKQLIKSVLKKEVPPGKLPFDVGVVVHNVATVYAIYEAVYLGKPLYERVVTVTGSCLANPKNLLARIGTPIKELINFCGPLKKEPAKIILGGPMMGIAQYTDEVPIIKSSNGVLLLNKREARQNEEQACIRCGACVRECPMGLMPCLINLASEKEKWAEAKAYRALDCIECGLCNFICPANRRLVQGVKRAKLEIK